jgi:hypothetical protein
MITFHEVKTHSSPILGMKACLDSELIKMVYSCLVDTPPANSTVEAKYKPMNTAKVLAEFPTVFQGISLFPEEYNIHTDPDISLLSNWTFSKSWTADCRQRTADFEQ